MWIFSHLPDPPLPSFRRGNLEKSSDPRWSDTPNLGVPKIFWEVSYTYILIIKSFWGYMTLHFLLDKLHEIPDYRWLSNYQLMLYPFHQNATSCKLNMLSTFRHCIYLMVNKHSRESKKEQLRYIFSEKILFSF